MQIEITTLDKTAAGSAELPDEIFATVPRADIMARRALAVGQAPRRHAQHQGSE
jgi:ribosomal protein L4